MKVAIFDYYNESQERVEDWTIYEKFFEKTIGTPKPTIEDLYFYAESYIRDYGEGKGIEYYRAYFEEIDQPMMRRRSLIKEMRRVFELSFGTHEAKELVGTYKTEKEARAEMVRRLSERNIKPYYYRYVGESDDYFIDYGSHVTFYFIKETKSGKVKN